MSIEYEYKKKQINIQRREYLGCGAHLHKEIEIVYVLNGRTKAYLDSEEYILEAGDLFFSFPNKVHYYRTFEHEESYLIIFSTEFFADFGKILLKNVPVCPVLRKDEMPKNIKMLFNNIYKAHISEAEYKEEICKGYLNVFLGEILPCFTYENVKNGNTDMLSSILSYCSEHYTDAVSLDTMATELHASKYYISRLFSEKIKISFNDYINMLRINDAKERLVKTDDSVTQIGIAVGYNTIRSFNRAFLSQTEMQPREYRNKNKPQK